jgi:hypothetical protein
VLGVRNQVRLRAPPPVRLASGAFSTAYGARVIFGAGCIFVRPNEQIPEKFPSGKNFLSVLQGICRRH